MMSSQGDGRIGVGLVGVGGYGEFCLQAFAAMSDVRIAAVCDVDGSRAERAAGQYGAAAYTDLRSFLQDESVQIVALNTPPYLHASQGLACLAAGKHLFCEKPLALTIGDGEALIAAAQANGVHLTVDYVMRRNPFWKAAADLAHTGVLGRLRHMDLTNHANGLALSADHWFWDRAKSGGIWIEHGVHFFDAFAWVSDSVGEVISSSAYQRSDDAIDRVEAILHYGDMAAHCYHAFDQSGLTEQTTATLTFEHGYVTLREWIPTSLELLTDVDRGSWESVLPGTVTIETVPDGRLRAIARAPEGKSTLYTRAIQHGLQDLIDAIRDSRRELYVTGAMGLASLRTALDATTFSGGLKGVLGSVH